MIRIAVCDDKAKEREKTMAFCRKYLKEQKVNYQLFGYETGEAFLEEGFTDVLLLDVKMKHVDGILLKDLLQMVHAKTRIIYVTEDGDCIKEAFGKNVFGFLEKPLDYHRFCEKMNLVREDILISRSYIYCREIVDYEKVYHKVYLREVMYVEARGRKTLLYTELGKNCVVCDRHISEWKNSAREYGFVSCHRSYVVNLNYVIDVGQSVKLYGGISVPLGGEISMEFKNFLRKFRENDIIS